VSPGHDAGVYGESRIVDRDLSQGQKTQLWSTEFGGAIHANFRPCDTNSINAPKLFRGNPFRRLPKDLWDVDLNHFCH